MVLFFGSTRMAILEPITQLSSCFNDILLKGNSIMQVGHVERPTLIHLSSVKGICAQLKPLVREVNAS